MRAQQLRRLAALALALAAGPLPHPAQAQAQAQAPAQAQAQAAAQDSLPTAVAAVIDYQRVLREAKAAQSIRDQIEAKRKIYQDQIKKEEDKLRAAEKELAKQRTVLSEAAFGQKRDDFQKKVTDAQRMVQQRRQQLDLVSGAALNQVRNAIVQIVSGMAEKRGFNIVLPSSGVLLFSPRIDLTQEVIAQLNAKLPSVKVPEKVSSAQ